MSDPHVEELTAPNPATTAWVPVNGPVANLGGGYEFGYDFIVAPVTLAATTEAAGTVVIPGSAHTFDGNPVMFEFQAPYVQTDAVANSYCGFALWEGGVEIGKFSITSALTASVNYQTVRGSLRYTPSAGPHTYSVKGWSTSGTGVLGAGTGSTGQYGSAYLRATSVAWYSGPGAGIPSPVVNGQWVKGAGGAAIWSAITPADVGLPKITRGTFAAGPPASPADGDIWIATQILAQSNYVTWQFMWDAGFGVWRFIGGAPATHTTAPNVANGASPFALVTGQSAGGWVYDTSAAGSLTLARGGVYQMRPTLNFASPSVGGRTVYVQMMSITSGAGLTNNSYGVQQASWGATIAGVEMMAAVTAGHRIAACVYGSGQMDINIYGLNASIVPVYVT